MALGSDSEGMNHKRLKERTKEIVKLIGNSHKERPVIETLLREVMAAFEQMELKLALARKHKETALAIAAARRKQARDLACQIR